MGKELMCSRVVNTNGKIVDAFAGSSKIRTVNTNGYRVDVFMGSKIRSVRIHKNAMLICNWEL